MIDLVFRAAIMIAIVTIVFALLGYLYFNKNIESDEILDKNNFYQEKYKIYYLTLSLEELPLPLQDMIDDVYMLISHIDKRKNTIKNEVTYAEFNKIKDLLFEETITNLINSHNVTDKTAKNIVEQYGIESLQLLKDKLLQIKDDVSEDAIKEVKQQNYFIKNLFK